MNVSSSVENRSAARVERPTKPLESRSSRARRLATVVLAAAASSLALGASLAGSQPTDGESALSRGDSGHMRPLFLEIPGGGGGPCGKRPPCALIAMIDGQMRPGQMMRAPGENWKLWWFQQGPLVSGTKISAVSGRQGTGHYLTWRDSESSDHMVLREKERDILAYGSGKAQPRGLRPGYELFSPEGGTKVTRSPGLHLDLGSLGKVEQVVTRVLRPISGPIAGGHMLQIAWGRSSEAQDQDLLVDEQRLIRVFVLSEEDYLLQVDSLLRSRTARAIDFDAEEPVQWRLPIAPPQARTTAADESASRSDWQELGKTGVQVLRSASTVDLFAVSDASSASLGASRDSSATPSWVAQRRRIDGDEYTFVMFADPRVGGGMSNDAEGLAMTLRGHLPGNSQRSSTLRFWVVRGWAVGTQEIDEQLRAFLGSSVPATAEQLRKREQQTESPWG